MPQKKEPMILAVVGPKGCGKSTLLLRAAGECLRRGLSSGGVISLSRMHQAKRAGYELLLLPGGQKMLLAVENALSGELLPGRELAHYCAYSFSTEALEAGNAAIASGMKADCLFIDEVGFWELQGGGWGESLAHLARREGVTLLGLRREIATQLRAAWGFEPAIFIDLETTTPDKAFDTLTHTITHHCKGE